MFGILNNILLSANSLKNRALFQTSGRRRRQALPKTLRHTGFCQNKKQVPSVTVLSEHFWNSAPCLSLFNSNALRVQTYSNLALLRSIRQGNRGENVLVIFKKNVVIAAGIGLYILNAIHPLSSVAESLAANTQDPHPSISVTQTATDLSTGNALQYFMLDDQGTASQPGAIGPDNGSQASQDSLLPDLFEDTVFEKLSIPGITAPSAEAEQYVIEGANGQHYTIKVSKESISGFASLLINNHEVMKFRSGYEVLDAYDRAQLVAQRLYDSLNGGFIDFTKTSTIRPVEEDGHYVLKIGNEQLASIDMEAAMANGNSEKAQALVWTNQLRQAFNVNAYHEPLASSIAAIIKSPGMSKKYKLPLSTAYFKSTGKLQSGRASWYGPGFHGRRSSDGSRFDMNQMTAAHRYLPFGTVVKVKNNTNGKQCLVQITDRGPFAHGRIIDLSKAAAGAIGMLGSGTAHVTIEVLQPGQKPENIASRDARLIGTTTNADGATKN